MRGLAVFALCIALLLLGYRYYARFAERVYGAEVSAPMPCETRADGVDFVRLPTWRVWLIQLLNIAGLGPVFGALSGALFGPVALLWIVLGCIFAGGMHDFLSALMSAENGGENMPESVGRVLGRAARVAMRALCVLIALLVGVVFTKGPAAMLHAFAGGVPALWWAALIFGYYFLATVLPIHVIIGRFYPVFGVLFLFMALGMAVALPLCGQELLPSLDVFTNAHPQAPAISVWPMLFVTSCCGAVSGFHATQCPMMVRCLGERRAMRRVFYGAMVAEGVIALIWATVGLSLRELPTDYVLLPGSATPVLAAADAGAAGAVLSFGELLARNPAAAAHSACSLLFGAWGVWLVVPGIVVLAVTSGDTAMRTCRLILAEAFGMEQRSRRRRLALALPLFAAVIVLAQVDFSVVWRYCGWATQLLACFTLWSLAVLLRRRARWYWLAVFPALFMTAMCATYILYAPAGAGLALPTASTFGAGAAAACLGLFFARVRRGSAAR